MGKSSLSGYTIYLRLLAMQGFNAIRPEYNCFISMIISFDTLCGFDPLLMSVTPTSHAVFLTPIDSIIYYLVQVNTVGGCCKSCYIAGCSTDHHHSYT